MSIIPWNAIIMSCGKFGLMNIRINASCKSLLCAIDIVTVTGLLQKIYISERNINIVYRNLVSYQPEYNANVSVICYNERCSTLKQVLEEDIAKGMHRGS